MPQTLISSAEFALMPDAPGKQELLEGELIQLPPARLSHYRIIRALSKILIAAVDESRVYLEGGYQMASHTWLQPDVSVAWPDQRVENDYIQGSPMIAIEVLSPGNSADEIDRKTSAYLKHGAAEVSIVYPRTDCMMVHKRNGIERITGSYTSDSVNVTINVPEILAAQDSGTASGYNK